MITLDQFNAAIANECRIVKHLVAQVPADGWAYRPTPGQRSTLELARYLTQGALGCLRYALDGNWDRWDDKAGADLAPAQIGKAMDKQAKAIAKELGALTPAKLKKATVTDFDGKTVPLSDFVLRMVLGQLAAYRMQLFLYAKQAGNAGLGTSDCWMGKKAKPKKAEKVAKAAG
ncbi:MAG TPA: hypothetical protein VEL07_17570 [Planctomycetota bacterium]|nr:hypothetical protein [Planctomycetota bacterium]